MAAGQGVTGSNPAVPTQVRGWLRSPVPTLGFDGNNAVPTRDLPAGGKSILDATVGQGVRSQARRS
jgi:hypothetical protein